MEPNLPRLQQRLGYEFTDQSLLQRALSHRSLGADHNERLEFLGDSLVNTAVAELLFRAFPNAPEGDLSAMRASLVCRETLAAVARELALGHYLLLGEGTSKTGGHRLDSILADAFEALLGALYLDSDWDQVRKVVRQYFSQKIDNIESLNSVRDAKSKLQEWLQANKLALPTYELIDIEGPGHAQVFRVTCLIDQHDGEYVGEGSSRRKAEQIAAEKALAALESGLV